MGILGDHPVLDYVGRQLLLHAAGDALTQVDGGSALPAEKGVKR
jgi:hypothetical protein